MRPGVPLECSERRVEVALGQCPPDPSVPIGRTRGFPDAKEGTISSIGRGLEGKRKRGVIEADPLPNGNVEGGAEVVVDLPDVVILRKMRGPEAVVVHLDGIIFRKRRMIGGRYLRRIPTAKAGGRGEIKIITDGESGLPKRVGNVNGGREVGKMMDRIEVEFTRLTHFPFETLQLFNT